MKPRHATRRAAMGAAVRTASLAEGSSALSAIATAVAQPSPHTTGRPSEGSTKATLSLSAATRRGTSVSVNGGPHSAGKTYMPSGNEALKDSRAAFRLVGGRSCSSDPSGCDAAQSFSPSRHAAASAESNPLAPPTNCHTKADVDGSPSDASPASAFDAV
eukprot:6114247-Prymnesium_polylepis.1